MTTLRGLILFTLFTAHASGQAIALRPVYETGQRTEISSELTFRYQRQRSQFGESPTNAFRAVIWNGETRILSAEAGKVRIAEMAINQAETRSLTANAIKPMTERSMLANKTITVRCPPGGENDPARWTVSGNNVTLEPAASDGIRSLFQASLFPAAPVQIGQTFRSDRVDLLFGAGWTGSIEMRLLGGNPIRLECRGSAKGDLVGGGQAYEAVQTADFGGMITLDPATKTILAVDLQGSCALDYVNLPAAWSFDGGMTLNYRGTPQPKMTPPTPEPTPAPVDPTPTPAPATGGAEYRDPAGRFTLTPAAGFTPEPADGTAVRFKHANGVSVTVTLVDSLPANTSPKQLYQQKFRPELEFAGMTADEEQPVTLAGLDGHGVLFHNASSRGFCMTAVSGTSGLAFAARGPADALQSLAPTIKAMRESLKWNPAPPSRGGLGGF